MMPISTMLPWRPANASNPSSGPIVLVWATTSAASYPALAA